jgi:tetratricopeptide (TPR) repeat protein
MLSNFSHKFLDIWFEINGIIKGSIRSVNDKIAVLYHQLGRVAQEKRQFDDAIAFYHKALQIFEDAGNFY